MAYLLKQTKLKYGTYLAIYESHYDKNKKRAVNHNVKSIGNIKTLITEQISDPVAYYKSVVDQMNLDDYCCTRPELSVFSTTKGSFALQIILPSIIFTILAINSSSSEVGKPETCHTLFRQVC